ncbi:MAG: hypothetical protein WEB00_05150 [Dehalococcoidia bacterium]
MAEVTSYFRNYVMPRRSYLTLEMCRRVLEEPLREEEQTDGRFRIWGNVPELGNRALRVVTLQDRTTIRNAFLDRGFLRKADPDK